MRKDKTKLFILEILLIIFLFFALFALNIFKRSILAMILGIYAITVSYLVKSRKVISINKKYATLLMFIFALLYLGVFYLFGLYFGFVKTKIEFSISTIFKFIIPISVIVFSSEIIRGSFLSHKLEISYKSNKLDMSPILTFISMVIIDLLIYSEVYDMSKLDDFLTILGFVFFASLSCNLLYNYVNARYDSKGIIIYRLITVLFIYVFPIMPDVYIFFRSFLRMIYPYIMYLVFEKLFSKNDYIISLYDKRKQMIENSILLIIVTFFVMLVSCRFRYGLIVVGSGSMTGALNKGDAVFFEKYEKQSIEEGQVIIFDYNGITTIHRVIDIQKVNGEYRYYTKGDANSQKDEEYRKVEDIKSLVKLRVKYIGLPTLWVRSLFEE